MLLIESFKNDCGQKHNGGFMYVNNSTSSGSQLELDIPQSKRYVDQEAWA